jgi:DNA invertase Pin-like site-specific DNA recombinase
MRVAAYARYSSDQQRDASLEDQLRNCREFAARQGWPEPLAFTDAAISGSRDDRPGYRNLLARASEFDVILLDDLYRLSRDNIEVQRTLKRLKFSGVRVIAIADGVDTAREDSKLNAGLRGLMGELYLDDLAKKTHRGLKGRALDGANAGGLAYGYRVTDTGHREIREDQAAIVRRIFDEYTAGRSPRHIAIGLNRDGIHGPHGGDWAASAIRADRKRSLGILANPIYIGRQIWNRSTWPKHPETGRRTRKELPESEWIVRELPHLAIVDRETWNAAQRRILGKASGHLEGARRGRPSKHLLSGLLRCCECGGPIVVVYTHRYGCSRAKERGTCANRNTFSIPEAETSLLAGIRAQLMTDDAYRQFQREAMAAMQRQTPNIDGLHRAIAKARSERDNVMRAIREGIITRTTKAELEATEAAVDRAEAALDAAKQYEPARILPRARAVWERLVQQLADHARDAPAARQALRTLLGGNIVVRYNENGDPVAEIAESVLQINVVAGAGFEPATFGL